MNRNQGPAKKGSRYCLQNYMTNDREKLNNLILGASPSLLSLINGEIEWISPNQNDKFYEYRDDFLTGLGINNVYDIKQRLKEFWPKNGPQWDGLAVVKGADGEKGVLLVEAKAHLNETKSDLKVTAESSIDLIKESMKRIQEQMGARDKDWTKKYYQLGNRISFLYFMNKVANLQTWLVLINFVGDKSYKETNIEDWLGQYKKIYKDMGIKPNCMLLDKIISV